MKWLQSCLACLTLSLPMTSSASELPIATPEDVGMSSEKLALVDRAMEKLVAQKRLAGAIVMITRRGNVVYQQSFGHQDLEADIPMRDDSILRIYSMTKAITSAAAMMLVDEQKLKLDAPVSQYLPELKGMNVHTATGTVTPKREMTVRDLMRHTAGLSYGFYGDTPVDKQYLAANLLDRNRTLESMTETLGSLPLLYEPGERWVYSISVDVLGRVIEVVADRPLDEFFAKRIFEPLDMKDTAFFVEKGKQSRFAANYNSDSKGTLTLKDAAATSRYLTKPKLFSGGGGLVSTARDYMRFLVMISSGGEFQGNRLLSPRAVDLMITNQLPNDVGWIRFGDAARQGVGFGLGFSVRVEQSRWDAQGRVGEYGWGGAASTHYWVSPADELAVVTLEQVMPYSFQTEFAVKGLIYDAIID